MRNHMINHITLQFIRQFKIVNLNEKYIFKSQNTKSIVLLDYLLFLLIINKILSRNGSRVNLLVNEICPQFSCYFQV